MQPPSAIFVILTIASVFVGCSQQRSRTAELSPLAPRPFYVPSTLMIQPRTPEPEPTALAYQVLPAADDDIFFVGRPEKAIYTTFPLAEISAYSIFVYDAQRISAPKGSGYRYTWHVREGISVP